MVATQDATFYAQRDHRRVLLGGDPLLAHFDSKGPSGLRSLLVDWARDFVAIVDPDARDWSAEAGVALVFATTFPGGGRRLVVEVSHKVARDALCTYWGRVALFARGLQLVKIATARLFSARFSSNLRPARLC